MSKLYCIVKRRQLLTPFKRDFKRTVEKTTSPHNLKRKRGLRCRSGLAPDPPFHSRIVQSGTYPLWTADSRKCRRWTLTFLTSTFQHLQLMRALPLQLLLAIIQNHVHETKWVPTVYLNNKSSLINPNEFEKPFYEETNRKVSPYMKILLKHQVGKQTSKF